MSSGSVGFALAQGLPAGTRTSSALDRMLGGRLYP